MIKDVTDYILKELIKSTALTDGDLLPGHIHELKENNTVHGIYISLVNLEEEKTLANEPHNVRQNGQTHFKEPPLFLNLYLLFACNFQDYGTSLRRLSDTVQFFQHRRVFTSENATMGNPFPQTLEKIIFDIYNLDFEKLNHLWGVLGCSYFPSVLYKVRLIKVQADISAPGPEITTIQVDTVLS